MRNKILMTLALLLTAVGGAWADETLLLTIESKDYVSFTTGSKTFDDKVTVTFSNPVNNDDDQEGWYTYGQSQLTVTGINGYTITSCKFYTANGTAETGYTVEGESPSVYLNMRYVFTDASYSVFIGSPGIKKIEVYGAAPAADPTVDVTPVTGKTNEWTFTMPAFDVEIAPIYAPVAQWAKVEDVDQLPTAIEGIYAESTDAIVKAGTVVEGQGTAMYFATTDAEMTAEKAAKANGWLATLPTAAGYDGAQTVYVWYYIKGADTPTGQEATAENTFNDSEICAEPITVNVLSNKFDIQFKAANDNTIEAGKATVKDGDEAATVTDGKLEGVKMGSKVKVKAKDGYKFRKAEAKKKAGDAPKLYSFTIKGPFTGIQLVVEFYEGDTWNDMITKYPSTLKKVRDRWVGFSTDGFVTDPSTEKWVEVTDQLVPNKAYYVE